MARRPVAREVINSLKGRQTAAAGDWVSRGPKDEEWVTSAGHFVASHEISGPSPLSNPLEIAKQTRHQRLGLAEGKQVTAGQLFGF
jgi:hypothetical protein